MSINVKELETKLVEHLRNNESYQKEIEKIESRCLDVCVDKGDFSECISDFLSTTLSYAEEFLQKHVGKLEEKDTKHVNEDEYESITRRYTNGLVLSVVVNMNYHWETECIMLDNYSIEVFLEKE